MVSNSGAQVSSESLINLQGELNTLSGNLNELYELLGQDLSRLGEYWRDSKYEEFMQEFHSSREKINELSEKYYEWANSYLPPRIEIIQKAEKANMSVDSSTSSGGSVSGGGASGGPAAVTGGGTGTPLSKNEKIEKFREAQRKVEEMARKQAESKEIDPRIMKKIIDDKSEMGAREPDIHADARAAAAAAEKAKKEKEQAIQAFMRRMADNHR